MDVRRVQVTGGSSYVLTLPKEWITSMKIKKNDPLSISMQSDGSLLITSKIVQESQQKTKEINVDQISTQTYLLRRLIGAYIAGATSIKIVSRSRISSSVRMTVRTFTQASIGPEVVEETDTCIVLKDLLNPLEMPFDKTIKRMHIIVKGMHEDAMTALETADKELAHDVVSRDSDVDRLNWLIARQHNSILQNVSLAAKMNITIEESSTYFLISRIIERIGDHAVQIAQNILPLIDGKVDKKIIHRLQAANTLAVTILNTSINSFFREDIQASNENIESVKRLESLCEDINTFALQQKGPIALSVGYIIESIRRIGEYATDISETVINHVVGIHEKHPIKE